MLGPPATVRYLSRSFAYDQAGRFSFTNGLPHQQTYGYDAFGNLNYRHGSYYNQPYQTDSATFTNNRRAGWSYDADGRITSTPTAPNANARTLSYDAAGRLVQTVDVGTSTTTTYTAGYDGDGRVLKESTQGATSQTTYSVRSTVLGRTFTTVTSAGAKLYTHVPAGGLVLPRQNQLSTPKVDWVQQNPMGVTETVADGAGVPAVYDALGNYIKHQYMNDPRPPMGAYAGASPGLAWQMMDPANYGMGCMVDGIPMSCSSAARWVNNGLATVDLIAGWTPNAGIIPIVTTHVETIRSSDPLNELNGQRIIVESISFGFLPGSESGLPQNPVPLPGTDAIRNRLTGDCNAYIASLLAKASELYGGGGNVAVAKDGLDLLNKISSFVLKDFLEIDGYPVGGTVAGSIAGNNRDAAGTATVLISTRFMYGSNPATSAMWQANYVSTAIHEMLHLGGRYNGYDDTQLATAASKLPGAAARLPAPPKNNRDMNRILNNSGYYNTELMKHCGGK